MSSPRQRLGALLSLGWALQGQYEPFGEPRRTRGLPRIGWSDLVAVAVELGVAPALWCAAREVGDALPAQVAHELRDHYRANTLRNSRFRRQLTEAVHALNAAGIEPLLFKGGLQLVDGTAGLGQRWMSDIDLAVPQQMWERAVDALRAIGYRQAPGAPFDHIHELPLARLHTPGLLDLHARIGSAPVVNSVLPLSEAWSASSELSFGGAQARALSPTHQVLQNVLHAAIQDLNHVVGGLPLRQLVELARLADVQRSTVDWTAIQAQMQAHGLSRVFEDHLWLAHRLVGMDIPRARSAGAGARFHEARVLTSFALGWPAEAQRNLRFAFGREYLDWLYEHGDRPVSLTGARVRHAALTLRRDGRQVVRQALQRRI
jgi:hypothetical protein